MRARPTSVSFLRKWAKMATTTGLCVYSLNTPTSPTRKSACGALPICGEFRMARSPGSGDAQNYQNIILSGIDRDGNQIENEVTFLVLDVVEELHISDYPITVRLNSGTSEKLLRRIAEVQLLGGGIVSVYNENQILCNLKNMGIPEADARTFTNDGCWEIILPGPAHYGHILRYIQTETFQC